MSTRKLWGSFKTLYVDERLELRLDRIVEGGFCSRHYHGTKAELFLVVEGQLLIKTFRCRDKRVIQQIGQSSVATPESGPIFVPPGQVHQFLALTDVVAYEMYRAAPGQLIQPNDIHRFTEGGVKT